MISIFKTSKKILDEIANLIHKKSGIVFPVNHLRVLDKRIQDYIKQNKHSEEDLLKILTHDPDILAIFVGHVTTNHTHFFRSMEQFETLQTRILPELIEKNASTKVINIWSAGCSSGEEPYTIALCVQEFLEKQLLNDWSFSILATDIDPHSLNIAKSGKFNISSLKHIPKQYHRFLILPDTINSEEEFFHFTPDICTHIRFKIHNLIEKPREKLMDIIFCRNVLIYFDHEIQEIVIHHLVNNLAPNRYFYISPSESISELNTNLEVVFLPKSIFYTNT